MNHSSHAGRVLGVHACPSGGWIVVVSKVLERLFRRFTMSKGIAELRSMNDRDLADIGLTRQQVEYAAKYGRWPIVKQSAPP